MRVIAFCSSSIPSPTRILPRPAPPLLPRPTSPLRPQAGLSSSVGRARTSTLSSASRLSFPLEEGQSMLIILLSPHLSCLTSFSSGRAQGRQVWSLPRLGPLRRLVRALPGVRERDPLLGCKGESVGPVRLSRSRGLGNGRVRSPPPPPTPFYMVTDFLHLRLHFHSSGSYPEFPYPTYAYPTHLSLMDLTFCCAVQLQPIRGSSPVRQGPSSPLISQLTLHIHFTRPDLSRSTWLRFLSRCLLS